MCVHLGLAAVLLVLPAAFAGPLLLRINLCTQLRESNPMMGHFVSLGLASQKLLNKSGYAYGSIVRITHSDRDKEVN